MKAELMAKHEEMVAGIMAEAGSDVESEPASPVVLHPKMLMNKDSFGEGKGGNFSKILSKFRQILAKFS